MFGINSNFVFKSTKLVPRVSILFRWVCPECEVDPLQMLSWWKAVDPGEFKMGSKEYWRTAMLGASLIPPHGQSASATELLTVKHIMPQPWKSFF